MSMYQSASRPDESVTRPWTTASSVISSRRRSRSGCAGAVMAATLRAGRSPPGCGLEHLVDDVNGRVGGLHVAADDPGRCPGERLVARHREVLPGPLDGDR